MPVVVNGADEDIEISKADGSVWTNEELESLILVADGKITTTTESSTVDFRYQGIVVAYIDRVYVGQTNATLHCVSNAFGGAAYNVNYLGFNTPSPTRVQLITDPTLPLDVEGRGTDVQIQKPDGSNWTDADVDSLIMVVNGTQLSNEAGSTLNFKDGNKIVAYIERDYYNERFTTLHCNAGAGDAYTVNFIGWEIWQ